MVGNSCGPTNHPDNNIGHAVLRLPKKKKHMRDKTSYQHCYSRGPCIAKVYSSVARGCLRIYKYLMVSALAS